MHGVSEVRDKLSSLCIICSLGQVKFLEIGIAPDKAAYCVFTQFRGPQKKFIN